MEPHTSGYFNSSMLFKASFLTISFTAIYFYRSGKQVNFLRMPLAKKDSSVVTPVKTSIVKKKKKTIYLTFDDGPDKGSKNVLAIMKKEKVLATMFIVGAHVYGSREQNDIYDSLVQCRELEICNHSYTHAFDNRYNKFYSDPDSAVSDFKRCADSLDFANNIIRTPGRNIWRTENISSTDLKGSATAADSIYNTGFTAVGWDIEWHYDNAQKPVQTDIEMVNGIDIAFANNKMKTKDHLVLLAHDRTFKRPDDSACLHRFITLLKQKDEYNFEVISEYPGISKDSFSRK